VNYKTINHLKTSIIITLILFLSTCLYSQILVYGDSRSNPEIHKKIISAIIKHEPIAVFNTGDLVFFAKSKKSWKTFVDVTADLRNRVPYYPILGNHEKNSAEFHKIFDLPNNERLYSITIQNIEFIVVNTNEKLGLGSKQYVWLEKQLSESQQSKEFSIVLLHHPPFSSGAHAEDPKKLQKSIVPMFEKYGVDAVFSGHNHMYERLNVNGINYFITGGGGAPLHKSKHKSPYSQKLKICYHFCNLTKVDGKLCVTAYNLNDSIIDSVDILHKQ